MENARMQGNRNPEECGVMELRRSDEDANNATEGVFRQPASFITLFGGKSEWKK
jgi:hypothetical protein